MAAAAISKILNVTEILAGVGFLSSKPVLLATIAWEATLALYLLIGDRHWSWRLTVATFSVFAVASGYAWATGADCNCIARSMGSGWILLLDLIVLIGLWYGRNSAFESNSGIIVETDLRKSLRRGTIPSPIAIVVSFAIGLTFASAATWQHHRIATSNAEKLEYLIPEMLIGKRWPLDSRIDERLKRLETGTWTIAIVRVKCAHCRKLLQTLATQQRHKLLKTRLALLVLDGEQWSFQLDWEPSDSYLRFSKIVWPGRVPITVAPAQVQVKAGQVVASRNSELFYRDIG